ncbi:MAG TPA: FkbM family methyltransferase, partial [Gaiellaceae bacterium]|nr:FkbM family methyltransferase [Gaiellaceae bacterium]
MALATAYRLARRGLDRLGVRRLPGAARVDAAVRRALGGGRVQVLGHTMRVDRADSLFLLRHGVYEPTMTRVIEERETVEVPCVTLDEHLGDRVRVDVVKMDVQGAEAAATRGRRTGTR